MSFLDKLTALTPFAKKEETLEYYFALNILYENLTAALWTIEGSNLKILQTVSLKYASLEDIIKVTDRLLDMVLGEKEIEPAKILFGIPDSWLVEDNLKEDYLKLLRQLVKELELTPMAYVATSHALTHFLEKQEGVPITAILVGFELHHLEVIVVRAGKIDGGKIISRGESSGSDIEKALLTFSDVETLPSKILLYGADPSTLQKLKTQLLAFPWMSKLSFLHFPKIEILPDEVSIKSVCFAGASEINSNVVFVDRPIPSNITKPLAVEATEQVLKETTSTVQIDKEEPGFVIGDVSEQIEESKESEEVEEETGQEMVAEKEGLIEAEDFQESAVIPQPEAEVVPEKVHQKRRLPQAFFLLKRLIPESKITHLILMAGIGGVLVMLLAAYLFLVKAEVKVFVEPKVLEKDTQVTSDPKQKEVLENAKIIPGQIVEEVISGSQKGEATGKKQIGDPAKGTIITYNKTYESKSLNKGTTLTATNGLKFTLDTTITIASQSATESGIAYGKTNATITASLIGADSNLPSGSELTVGNLSSVQVSAKAEGNFSGGTSKDITVVSDADQKKLLAQLASDLRRQAKQKLQEKLPDKKILEEALAEEIMKKSYSKNINDQANEFSLNLTLRYKGTAFEEKDLKSIVSKLVTTQVPEGFELNLAETETQADVSKLEKDGRVIFLARFKAKLMPKLDLKKLTSQIKGQTPQQVADILKSYDHVLGSEIKLTPSLPTFLQRLPVLERNIKVEVGLK